MATGFRQAKQPVSGLLAGPYGHPWHPILVTVPIGAWVSSLIFDVGSHIMPGSEFLVQGSAWLIAVGILGALLAACVGFLDLFAIPTGTPAFRTALLHMGLNLPVTAAFGINLLWRGGESGSVAPGMIALSAASLAALAVSGYLGGKLAFRYGVRVADESVQADGYAPHDKSSVRRSKGGTS